MNNTTTVNDERYGFETGRRQLGLSDIDKKQFEDYKNELDEMHNRYERIVKLSRDITIESKRIIFHMHRITTVNGDDERKSILNVAFDRLQSLKNDRFIRVAEELKGQDQYHYNRAITSGIQEFLEAYAMYTYLMDNRLISYKECQDILQYPTELINQSEDLFVQISMVDYLCGILDVAGELMRYAMNDVSAGHLSTIDHVVHFLRRLYCQLINIGNSINSKELTNKIRVLHQCIIKVETTLYMLTVRRSEVPEYMLADVMKNAGGTASFDVTVVGHNHDDDTDVY